MSVNRLAKAWLIDIVNKCPVARAEKATARPAAKLDPESSFSDNSPPKTKMVDKPFFLP